MPSHNSVPFLFCKENKKKESQPCTNGQSVSQTNADLTLDQNYTD